MKERIAIFGAGIAGLTVAHELVRRGHPVCVYEENPEAGGFFRSARGPDNIPTEYSWHGMGPWYHNVFDILEQIPARDGGTVYATGLSRPIDFGMAPDDGEAAFDETLLVNVRRLFQFTALDTVRWAWLMLRTWTAGKRSEEQYAAINAAEAFRPVLSDTGWRTWRAGFGPWVGSDWTNVSLHQVGLFFRKHLLSRPAHLHPADERGPAWRHGSRSGWLLLRGPSSEVWFDPWVAALTAQGVRFSFGESLLSLGFDGTRVTGARLASGENVDADIYVLATNPFAGADILARTPALAGMAPFRSFRPLVADGPHVQVSFRIAFRERIAWPRPRVAVVVADSEFNLTLFAEEQVWPTKGGAGLDLGAGIESLWTGTACVAKHPGRLFGLPLERCTREQFVAEIHAQIASCGALDALLREANGGRTWKDFDLAGIEVWHEWIFSPDGIRSPQPKWVNTTHTQPWLPPQRTPVANLVLAGAHTRTDADVWSIEAAVESGRRAARVVSPDVVVRPTWTPAPLRALQAMDDALYAVGGPHVLDVLVAVGAAALVGLIGWSFARQQRTRVH